MSTVSRRHRREREEKALFVSACQSGDTELLRLLGASCGFRTKEVRRMVYPVLTGTHGMRAAIRASRLPLVDRQIMLDTARSFAFPDAMRWAPTVREKHVTELSLVLDYVFSGHQPAAGSVRREQGARAASRGERCYYQGAHDIASVLLLQLGAKQAAVVMDALVESHLAGFVRPTMACPDGLVQVTLYLLARLDAGLMAHFQAADMPLHFCLPWIITWFAHSIDNMDMCARFFDLFISTHPLMPVYVCVSLLLHYAPSLKATRADLTELYPIVSKLPTRIASPQEATRVIHGACMLYQRHPPSVLFSAPPLQAPMQTILSQWRRLKQYAAIHGDGLFQHVTVGQSPLLRTLLSALASPRPYKLLDNVPLPEPALSTVAAATSAAAPVECRLLQVGQPLTSRAACTRALSTALQKPVAQPVACAVLLCVVMVLLQCGYQVWLSRTRSLAVMPPSVAPLPGAPTWTHTLRRLLFFRASDDDASPLSPLH